MGCMRIYDSNWTQPEYVANKSISSELAAYPEDNLYDYSRRTKTWRSGGYWNVVSGSNTIIFRETTSVDLTATITNGEYTSTSSFLSAIKSALEAAGASNYTVSIHTDGRIKIVSDGSGGGGILEFIWTSSSAFGDTIGFDTSSDDTGSLTYIADVLRIHSSEWIEWDLGFASNPTGFFAISNRNKPIPINTSAVIKIQGNWTNTWSSPVVEFTVPYKDYIFALENTSGFYSGGLRYWRFYIEDKDNALGYVELGFVFLGDFYSPTRGCPVFPLESTFEDRSSIVYSESGQLFSQKKPQSQVFNIQWDGLKKDELERMDNIFSDQGIGKPFFLSIDPSEAFSTDSEKMVRYVNFISTPSIRLVSPNNWSMTWEVRESL